MKKLIGISLIFAGVAATAMATPTTPEIDPASGGSALAVLAGALLMIKARRKRS